MKIRRPAAIITLFLIIAAAGLILLKPALTAISAFLSKSEKVSGNVLIIEGWLSYNDLSAAIAEFEQGKYEYIFTTGLKATPDYYNVNTDGYLIFYTGKFLSGKEEIRTIEVKASSELGGENAAHFNLWVNDSSIADFRADKRMKKYPVSWDGSPVDSVMVQFDNDLMGDFGDRNLFVKEIILNGEIIIPFLNNSVYDISDLDNRNRIVNNMNSNAETTAKRLFSMGIDSSVVISMPGSRTRMHRTLASASAVRNWLRNSDIRITGINIISSGTHSRRTWMTFDKILGHEFDIGIIALHDHRNNASEKLRIFKTVREAIAYLYYWIILIPY